MQTLARLLDRFFLFRHDPLQSGSIVFAILLLTMTATYLLMKYHSLPSHVPFWYSLPWGEEQLAPKRNLWFLLGGTIVVGLLNMTLARLTHTFFPMIGRLATAMTLMVVMLSSVAVVRIIRLLVP